MSLGKDERFAAIGDGVRIDPQARVFGHGLIRLGHHVRIDAGAILSAQHPLVLGDFVHIAAGAKVFANAAPCTIEDFVSLSPDAKVFTGVDDFIGAALTNPTVDAEFRALTAGEVVLGKHVLIGAGSVVFPGARIGFGASVGALSIAKGVIERGAVVVGPNMRRIATRDVDRLAENEAAFLRRRSGTA